MDLISELKTTDEQRPIKPWIDELASAICSIYLFSPSGNISKWNDLDLYIDLETKDSEYMRWPRLENFWKMSNPYGAKMKSIRLYKPLEDEKFVEVHDGEQDDPDQVERDQAEVHVAAEYGTASPRGDRPRAQQREPEGARGGGPRRQHPARDVGTGIAVARRASSCVRGRRLHL